MVRPTIVRKVSCGSELERFGTKCPRRKVNKNCEVILTVDEFEAIRLKDNLELEQKICADSMNISQPTFSRILSKARNKIAKALTECGVISVRGGVYMLED